MSKWRVSLSSAQGPIERVLDAPSQEIAISRAMMAFPGQPFTDVDVKLIDAQSNVPTAQASQQNQLPQQLQPLQPIKQMASPAQILQSKQQQVARESIVIDPKALSYPYSITLPVDFRRILKDIAPGQISVSNGQYRVIIEGQDEMRFLLNNLKKHYNRNAVKIIAEGIRSSIA